MIFGTILGSVTAHERIEVRRSGSVEGNVACARLVVQDGAILCGKVETRGERRSRTTTTESTAQALASVA
jgi:cytoskeletal protein CcmA (bactofilin family)